ISIILDSDNTREQFHYPDQTIDNIKKQMRTMMNFYYPNVVAPYFKEILRINPGLELTKQEYKLLINYLDSLKTAAVTAGLQKYWSAKEDHDSKENYINNEEAKIDVKAEYIAEQLRVLVTKKE